MNIKEFKELIKLETEKQGVKEYELYYTSSEETSVGAFGGEINEFTSSEGNGACLRLVWDGKMGYASTEELSAEEAVSLVAKAIDNASTLESSDPVFLGKAGENYQDYEKKIAPLPSTDELIGIALDTLKEVEGTTELITDKNQSQAASAKGSIAISNSNGLDLFYEYAYSVLYAVAVVQKDGEMNDGFEVETGNYNDFDLKKIASKAAEKAVEELGAEVPETGVVPVVLSGKAMRSLLGVYSTVFSSEAAQKGLSLLAGKEGEAIAAPIINLIDDPFYKDSLMPINFDSEGSATYTKKVIENGVLNTLLYNMQTAAKAGKKTTGNASKASYMSAVGVRPFTMYIAPGEFSEEELFAKAGNGVYITGLNGLHAGANTISGDFSLQSNGFMIENGKKTKAVKAFTVSGNFFELLKNITALGNEIEKPNGGFTAFASPAVLVDNLSIAGKK